MTKCPYVPPHEWNARFPAPDAAPPRGQGAQGGHRASSRTSSPRPTGPAGSAPWPPAWPTGRPTSATARRGAAWRASPASITARACRSYAGETFEIRARREPAPSRTDAAPAFGKRKAVLYATCFVNFNNTDIGVAARAGAGQERRRDRGRPSGLLRHAQARAGRPRSRRRAARQGRRARCCRWVDKGYDVVALTPSCAPDAEVRMAADRCPRIAAVERLSRATFDLSRIRRRHRQEARAGARPGAARGRRQPASRLPRARPEHGRQGRGDAASDPRRPGSR